MRVRVALIERIAFIRQFYTTSSTPYLERIRKIEAGEDPWVPKYSEDSEPPFLSEWLEADESLQVLGLACTSMLTATLHMYFKTWQKVLGVEIEEKLRGLFKKNWVQGYKELFANSAGVPFNSCPVNLKLLEELVLARNRTQHPESLSTIRSSYSSADLQKLPHPFFIDERELAFSTENDQGEKEWLMPPTIRVTAEKLESVMLEVERFAQWMETVELNKPQTP
jgi:hypothetical protein